MMKKQLKKQTNFSEYKNPSIIILIYLINIGFQFQLLGSKFLVLNFWWATSFFNAEFKFVTEKYF